MEIIVATTIFVIVFMALLSLFNYTLKINRRAEALRQASQGARDFVEFLVKEIRNGQIDYGFVDPQATVSSSAPYPCPTNLAPGVPSYSSQENKLGIINLDGVEECFYYGKPDLSYTAGVFSSSTGATDLILAKGSLTPQIINPPNFRVDNLMFLIRPVLDPYSNASGSFPKVAPLVSIIIKFVTQLPTGEQVPINYQTSVTPNQYDIPNQ